MLHALIVLSHLFNLYVLELSEVAAAQALTVVAGQTKHHRLPAAAPGGPTAVPDSLTPVGSRARAG